MVLAHWINEHRIKYEHKAHQRKEQMKRGTEGSLKIVHVGGMGFGGERGS